MRSTPHRRAWLVILAAVAGACGTERGAEVDADIGVEVDADVGVEVDAASVDAASVSAEIEVATRVPETEPGGDTADLAPEPEVAVLETATDTSPATAPETVPEIEPDIEPDTVTTSDAASENLPPLVTYALGGARRLFFLNNPEQLVASDLGDGALGDHTLLRVTANGACRSFFEHLNKSGRTIGFGIQLYNPGPNVATVTVLGSGWTAGIDGGVPFADALAGVGAAAPVVLGAGKSTWILRRDDAVPAGSFFSGVVDYDVTGADVIVNHIAYDAFAGLDGSTSELGYVQRIEPDQTHEARMYKGLASASEAFAELAFVIDDATATGPLPVRVRRYDLATSTYAEPAAADGWVTHIGPAQNADATASDMAAFTLASWGVFDPFATSDGEGKYPNLANWGVVMSTTVRVENRGTRPRTIAVRTRASPGAGAGLALRVAGGAWTAHHLEKDASLDVTTLFVPAGEARAVEIELVLGGPSGGALRHAVVATD